MSEETIQAEALEANELVIKNAVIEAHSINITRGYLTVLVQVGYGNGVSQAFGGHALYLPKEFDNHKLVGPAGHFLHRLLSIAGVAEVSQLNGRSIRVEGDDSMIHAIGHIVADDWFEPAVDFAELIQADQQTAEEMPAAA